MNKGLTRDVWLYFNTQADNDNIAASSNACFPAKNLVNMAPTGDSLLTLYFKSMKNSRSNGNSEEVANDNVTVNLAAENTHFAAMTAIAQAINSTRPTFSGFVEIADDHTIIVGGGAGSRTAATGITFPGASVLANSGIGSCGAVLTVPPLTGLHTVAVTATANGLTTGIIANGTRHATVTSASANNIVLLPKPVPGTVVFVTVTANGCELRAGSGAAVVADASDTISIGGNTASAGHESALAANMTAMCICTSATSWVGLEIVGETLTALETAA